MPPACTHILPAVCLSALQGWRFCNLPVICSRASPLVLGSSYFQRIDAGERWSRNKSDRGRQAELIGLRTPNEELLELEVRQSLHISHFLLAPTSVGTLGAGAAVWEPRSHRCPVWHSGGSCSALRKQWESRHPPPPKTNCILFKSRTFTLPTPSHPQRNVLGLKA